MSKLLQCGIDVCSGIMYTIYVIISTSLHVYFYLSIRTCLMRTLRHIRLQMDFVEACGKELKSHPHEENEASHYCNSCDVS